VRRKIKQSPRVSKAKNLVRGALPQGPAKLMEVLSAQVAAISAEEYDLLAPWLDQYPSKRVRMNPLERVSQYAELWSGNYLTTTDLAVALRWNARFLKLHKIKLDSFSNYRSEYEVAYLAGNYERANEFLNTIEAEFGHSFWLIECRLALLQRSKGLEAQKQFVRRILELAPNTVTAFFSYYASERNEDATSIDRYNMRLIANIDKQEVREPTKLFLKAYLAGYGILDAPEDVLSQCLSVAASLSLVDAYEAHVATCIEIARRADLVHLRPLLDTVLDKSAVSDWRTTTLVAIATLHLGGLPFRDLDAEVAFLEGRYSDSYRHSVDALGRSPDDVDSMAILALTGALSGIAAPESLSSIQSDILSGLSTLASLTGSTERAAGDLGKLVQNNKGVRCILAVIGYREILWSDQPPLRTSLGTLIVFGSPKSNPVHWWVLDPGPASRLVEAYPNRLSGSTAARVAMACIRGDLGSAGIEDPAVRSAVAAVTALYHNKPEDALEHAIQLSRCELKVWSRLGIKLQLYCLIRIGREDDAIRHGGSRCAQDGDLHNLVPIRTLLGGKRWRDLRHLARDLALPILLDMFWRYVNESEHETTRRIAYDEFLRAHKFRKPSDIEPEAHSFDRAKLVYFLRYLCVPEVMDVSFDIFANSLEIIEERMNVCTLLSRIDSEFRDEYSAEFGAWAKYRAIQAGLRDIDRSRVHVNTDAIARWAEKELQEQFQRYQDLVKANVRPAETSPQPSVSPAPKDAADHVSYPDNEASAVFGHIIDSIKAEFLKNSDHGLDAYLSMRVRHGSLSGHLRGPLEEQNLIVSKKGDRYEDNAELANQIGIKSGDRADFYGYFASFSKEYDSIITTLTKDRLQVRTAEKPLGMFGWYVSDDTRAVIESQVTPSTTFDDLLVLTFSALGIILREVSLVVHDYILTEVKADVESAFEALRSSLERCISTQAYTLVNSRIADAIPAVQAAIHRVAEWFVPVQRKEGGTYRTLEQILDIGLESARRTHPGFTPKIERLVDDILISYEFLTDFTDIILNLIDNVYRHSGSNSPWIRVSLGTQPMEGQTRRIVIDVESEVSGDVLTEEVKGRLARIKERLDAGDYHQRVNLEGGSGLLKLKRLVERDPRQGLSFDFTPESTFRVQLNLVRSFFKAPGIDRIEEGGGTP